MNRVALFLALALFAGSASAALVPQDRTENEACIVEGSVNLRINGDDQFGSLSGWIGQTNVYARINSGRVMGDISSLSVRLYVDRTSQDDYQLSGWIGTTYLTWRGFNGWFTPGYACLN